MGMFKLVYRIPQGWILLCLGYLALYIQHDPEIDEKLRPVLAKMFIGLSVSTIIACATVYAVYRVMF